MTNTIVHYLFIYSQPILAISVIVTGILVGYLIGRKTRPKGDYYRLRRAR